MYVLCIHTHMYTHTQYTVVAIAMPIHVCILSIFTKTVCGRLVTSMPITGSLLLACDRPEASLSGRPVTGWSPACLQPVSGLSSAFLQPVIERKSFKPHIHELQLLYEYFIMTCTCNLVQQCHISSLPSPAYSNHHICVLTPNFWLNLAQNLKIRKK